MPIYTKTGDKGETSLFGGKRVSKAADQVEAYGSVDELNSWVGLISAELLIPEKRVLLQKIQSDLFFIGGYLAGWEDQSLEILSTRVTEMEVEIDAMEGTLESLKNFILPGGTPLAAHIHVTRSVCRRVERYVVRIHHSKDSYRPIIQYLNRLSDLFFVLARFVNKEQGIQDIPWSGIERK